MQNVNNRTKCGWVKGKDGNALHSAQFFYVHKTILKNENRTLLFLSQR